MRRMRGGRCAAVGEVTDMSSMDQVGDERLHANALAPGGVISLLLEQHSKIRDMFTAVQMASGWQRRELFDQLRELLAVHESAEELVLRPVSRKDAGGQVVYSRNEEEADAAHALAELEKMDVSSEEFARGLAELEKAVTDHAEREELEEFRAVQAAHTDDELRALGDKLLKAEAKAPNHPHPSVAGSPAAQRVVGPFAALLDRARDAHVD
jgi:hypothetical protein